MKTSTMYSSGDLTIDWQYSRGLGRETSSIQARIDRARYGDVILLGDGVFDEDIVINRSGIILKGSGDTFVKSITVLEDVTDCTIINMRMARYRQSSQ